MRLDIACNISLFCSSHLRLHRGSLPSRALETRVLGVLVIATDGGFTFGSAEHDELLVRMEVLGAELSAASGVDGKVVMEAYFNMGMANFVSALGYDNTTLYSGPNQKVVLGTQREEVWPVQAL